MDQSQDFMGEMVMLWSLLSRTCLRRALVVAALVAFLLPGTAGAQLPITQLTTIYPAGGQQGTEVEVQVAGGDQDSLGKMVFSHRRNHSSTENDVRRTN